MNTDRSLRKPGNYSNFKTSSIRSLRRKMQRCFKMHLSNAEVAEYWTHSKYGSYFRDHLLTGPS